jgi:mycofactocin system glycosyltransferase
VTGLPTGFEVVIDEGTRQLDDSTLFGASSGRLVRLSAAGRTALAELRSGPVRSPGASQLGRRLIDAGLAHPRPPRASGPLDVTVILPVRDRTDGLAACLGALGQAYPVVVVDDASADRSSVAAVCAEHGATLIRRDRSGGPGVARNSGLEKVATEFVAFIDSDCVPSPDWVDRLVPHLADPSVGAVAPRIVTIAGGGAVGRYSSVCGSLDLGRRAARVAPSTAVSYVPTAALIVRRAALLDVARDGDIFDPELLVGEDVDLVWRLYSAGWRLRYEPSVEVGHREPTTWPALLSRRYRYGKSAGELARRHPDFIAPLVLYPWPALAAIGVLTRRPLVAMVGFALAARGTGRSLAGAGVPSRRAAPATFAATRQTWLSVGRYATQFAAPVLAALAIAPSRRPGRRLASLSLLLAPPLAKWVTLRPRLDPARFVLARVADDIAYGTGVWRGSLKARTITAIRPKVVPHFTI